MRFTIAATAALVAGAAATYKQSPPPAYGADDTTVTEPVTKYTTYCPSATEVTHKGVTYTVTEATTLTIDDCDCTSSTPAPYKPTTPVEAHPTTTPAPYKPTTYAPVPSSYPATSASTAKPVPSSYSSYTKPETHPAPAPSSYPATSASTANPVPSSSSKATLPPAYPTTLSPVPSYPAGNSTKPIGTGTTTARPPVFTGAASKVGAGAGLAAIFGLAALAL
ncbi:hypothetical protein BDZ85DRAFT_323413 [Elsinoe ampelina]|uniref:Cell wall protein SED1 n=1 Tax=Elsinoe ampelina TaxID=302913 RepID=A0A6A6FXK3_9PEZI|nr:hypothetical protein BDZ85DRAFT_323413 [Elsinoe ampelina]